MTINMKNILKGLAVAVCFSTMLTACTGKFLEYNTNQHEATEDMMGQDNLKTGALFRQLQRSVIFFADGTYLDSDYQVMYNLLADSYAGYFAPTGTWNNGVHCGSYFMTEGWRRALFANKYVYAMQAWLELEEFAQKNTLPEISAMAAILKVASMHQVADYYGPIPYSQVGQNLSVTYDSLEDVYNSFFEELGTAIDALHAYRQSYTTILAEHDYMFGGDVIKWIRFANSLRLRLAMRVVYADAALAQSEAEKSLNDAVGVITSASDRALLAKSSVPYHHHPVYEINQNFNNGDTQMAASMDVYLNGYSDPRREIYFKPAADGAFHGVRNGVHAENWTNYRNPAGKVSAPNSEKYDIVWLHASEVAFLRAEYELRWGSAAAAKEYYEQGIALSFEETGATGAAAYMANNTAVPANFKDNVSSNSINALSDITIAWEADADFEENLERIMTQKWLAIFPNGCEAWAEYRRTGYPKLLPVVNNDSNGAVSTELQIRRVPYPHDEFSTNAAGVASGIAKLGGLDNVGTKLWWDQKPR